RDIGSRFANRLWGHRKIRPTRVAAAFVALHALVATLTCHVLAAIALGRRGHFSWKEARELRQDRPPQREAHTQRSQGPRHGQSIHKRHPIATTLQRFTEIVKHAPCRLTT